MLTSEDPWVLAQIDAAVAPYVGRLSPQEVEWMREQLADVLMNDENAVRLLRGAHPGEPATVEESGEVVRGRPAAAAAGGARGGRAKAG